MLIIVISNGCLNDPFTCSLTSTPSETDINDLGSVCRTIHDKQKVTVEEIDEILIVEGEEIVKVYNCENGLDHSEFVGDFVDDE